MANHKNLIPFIKRWEGGISKDTRDQCSKDPLPDGSGYHTNKGICWMTFKSVFGDSKESVARFYAMNDADWEKVYKGTFWDKIKGDDIKSQRIADALANWAWGSGVGTPAKTIQKIVGVKADGVIGKQTVDAINSGNEEDIYNKFKKANIDFFDRLSSQPTYSMYRKGWFNRLNDLYDSYMKTVKGYASEGLEAVKKKPVRTIAILVLTGMAIYGLYWANKKAKRK